MGKTPERRVFTSALRYRRKVPASTDNQQPQQPADVKQQSTDPKQQPQRSYSTSNRSRSSRSPPARRFRPTPRQTKQQQPALLKQLLWKAKAVQPTPAALALTQQQRRSHSTNNAEDEEEDEEVAFAKEQRQVRKLLASKAEALAATKSKAVAAAALPSPASFVTESSSQETQSGSEDEAVFLPYRDLLPTVQPPAKWHVFKQQEGDAGSAEETDGEETASPVVPSETMETQTTQEEQEQDHEQGGLEKAVAVRRKQRQKYKLKQKQKRAAVKEQKRLQHKQKQMHERNRPTEEDAGSTQEEDSTTVDIFHPPTNLASRMDTGVCRAVLSQLKEVVPYIVVGDVACPMVADEQPLVSAGESNKGKASAADSEEIVVDFRQHVIAMLDRSKETQMQYRESFVVENSGFDAASSYDFFKRRFCEVQRSAGIVYY